MKVTRIQMNNSEHLNKLSKEFENVFLVENVAPICVLSVLKMYNIATTVLRRKEPRKLVITKIQNFHHIKKKTLAMQYCFYFSNTKKVILKNTNSNRF